MIELYAVGDTLEVRIGAARRDGQSSIAPGNVVKVIQTFKFTYNGEPCQDLTVQRGHDLPIALLNKEGAFKKLPCTK